MVNLAKASKAVGNAVNIYIINNVLKIPGARRASKHVRAHPMPYTAGLAGLGVGLGLAALVFGGRAGPVGPQGVAGKDGVPGQNYVVGPNNYSGIAALVTPIPGAQGPQGPSGAQGVTGASPSAADIERAVQAYLAANPLPTAVATATPTPYPMATATPVPPTSTPKSVRMPAKFDMVYETIRSVAERDCNGFAKTLGLQCSTLEERIDGNSKTNPELARLTVGPDNVIAYTILGNRLYEVSLNIDPAQVRSYLAQKATPQELGALVPVN